MSLGRLLYLGYHQPRERLETAIDAALAPQRDRAMRTAAEKLRPLPVPRAKHLAPIRFLTGERFAHQTAFCAHSLVMATAQQPPFEFFDDGTLSEAQAAMLLRLFPGANVIPAGESFALVEKNLPTRQFPSLRAARDHSPLMRKLLDLRAGRRGPSLYLDSDMLFFSRPDTLLDWLVRPVGSWHMLESGSGAYVDTPAALAPLVGKEILPGVNTGIVALDDGAIDWPALERTAAKLGPERLAHKWAEQTLFAWLLQQLGARALDRTRYHVCGSRIDLVGPPPVLRHYVYKSKMPYLAREWRRFA